METKLCRICGKLGENYVHIFKTEGLKNKIETCLPIIVSNLCLLPDTICSQCLENVDNFYSFIKNCLQNIIVLEAQYDITESCLKTKRKHDKGNATNDLHPRIDKTTQTDPIEPPKPAPEQPTGLVCYEIDSDANSDTEANSSEGKVVLLSQKKSVGDLITEIAQRKSSRKRKADTILSYRPKIFKMSESSSRRKSKQPKKLGVAEEPPLSFAALERICERMGRNVPVDLSEVEKLGEYTEADRLLAIEQVQREVSNTLLHVCLTCETRFSNPAALSSHVFEAHGADFLQPPPLHQPPQASVTGDPGTKKKMPSLLKITDLMARNESNDDFGGRSEYGGVDEVAPPTLQPSYACPVCPAMFSNKGDLFTHIKVKHPAQAALLCGLCFHISSSYISLNNHMEFCRTQHNVTGKYLCKVCYYNDDNAKIVENHVVVHDFIIALCKKQAKMFDPYDYVDVNENSDSPGKIYTCNECEQDQAIFMTFKEFSAHRRSAHQIFHCDLCNKFYGRNSHLWKHVNRLHKGHPSITCQMCYKTSASKYHLSQHFNKIHSAKPNVLNNISKVTEEEDFMSQKFRAFDFQSVKQSFMRQELLERQKKMVVDSGDDAANSDEEYDDDGNYDNDKDDKPLPKEIDSSSNLYTNIITNYTPPINDGEFKCPKCFKGFHKKTLLKKHKKNCRPRLQKDLLTRCKTCSRIFKDRQSLTKHLINYHSEYVCEICEQKVQSKCEIVAHIRFSHPNCHLFCSCGNILRSRADLEAHRADHTNSFVCQFCGDALSTKIKLKMHILSLHRKILSLSCGICLKLFETQHILREHVNLVHKDRMKPFVSCTVCGKNYGSKWKTYDHLNKSHGRIFKACKACLEVFDTEAELMSHYARAHSSAASSSAKGGGSNAGSNSSSQGGGALEAKKEEEESDYEDNDEKNFSGSDSLDGKEDERGGGGGGFAGFQGESLLEKRLLGAGGESKKNNCVVTPVKPIKAETVKEQPKKPLPPPPTLVPSPMIMQASKSPSSDKIRSIFDDPDYSYGSSQNQLLQNSSKRTVYVNSNDPSLCEICFKTWPAKKHLWQHYIRCHKQVAATVCGICLKTNTDYKALQIHLRETHPTLLHGQGFGSNFICRICGRYHNASSKLRLHMAIHENFDWNILDPSVKEQFDTMVKNPDSKLKSNGFTSDDFVKVKGEKSDPDEANEDINYESMIEQVECTSESECDDSDNETENYRREVKQESSSDEEESDGESVASEENSLEAQMLKNMLKEKQTMVKVEPPKQRKGKEINVKVEYTSSDASDDDDDEDDDEDDDDDDEDEEDTSNSATSYSDEQQPYENGTNVAKSAEGGVQKILGGQKPDELDSAIRSISFDGVQDVEDDVDSDYGEVQPQGVNENEIETAVGSIL